MLFELLYTSIFYTIKNTKRPAPNGKFSIGTLVEQVTNVGLMS
jgi:hypothetical protein